MTEPKTSKSLRNSLAALGDGQRAEVLAADCPSRAVLAHITSRWGVLVLVVLLDGTHRFSQLRRAIGGVSEKMLAQTLDALAVAQGREAVAQGFAGFRLGHGGVHSG